MRSRWKFILGAAVAALIVVASLIIGLGWNSFASLIAVRHQALPPIRLGLLHSQSGLLSLSEKSILDAEIMAIDEINTSGGVGGRQVIWSAPDCRSDVNAFVSEARRLLEQDKVAALFGCWTSESRKAVIPVLDEFNSILFFPGNFEGIERSPRVFYAGGSANQSVLPAVRWAYDTLGTRKFFVVGLEEVWSRTTCEIAKDGIKAAGAELVGESYTVSQTPAVDLIVDSIRQAKPDLVLNFLYGESNIEFYKSLRRAGMPPDKLPVIAFGFAEDESRRFQQADIVGQYAAMNYFQSVDRPKNREFIRKFRTKYGESRVVGDAMVAAYDSVMFWAQSAREVGTGNTPALISNLLRQSMDAPDGIITIDSESQAFWRPFHIGRLMSNGQFELVWSISKPIRPVLFVGTRTSEEWKTFLADLKKRWRGGWSAGASLGSGSNSNSKPQ